jgi:hypothetical protein
VSRPVVPAERVGDGARGWNIDCGRLSSWWRLVRRNLSGFGWERWLLGLGVGWARCWVLREQPEGCFLRVATDLVRACERGVGSRDCGLVPLGRTAHHEPGMVWGG